MAMMIEKLAQAVRRVAGEEAEVVGAVQYPHPADRHLWMVLVKREDEHTPYVLWSFNAQDGGLFWGHYHSNRKDALVDFHRTVTDRLGLHTALNGMEEATR